MRIVQKNIELDIHLNKGPDVEVILKPVANQLTGETVGDTSEYRAQSDQLKGQKKFLATIHHIKVRGQDFKDIAFKFPEGNEESHHEEDHHEEDDHKGHDHH